MNFNTKSVKHFACLKFNTQLVILSIDLLRLFFIYYNNETGALTSNYFFD